MAKEALLLALGACATAPLHGAWAGSVDAPSPFGHAMLRHFTFQEGWVNLNHGSYGACPLEVQRARQGYQQLMDSNPEAFFRTNMSGDGHTRFADLIDIARERVAGYVGADPDTIVLVENASGGLNAVIRSLANFLRAGHAILYLDTAYVEVKAMLRHLAGQEPDEPRSPCLQVPLVQVNITPFMPEISRRKIVSEVETALGLHAGKVGLCVFSHIASTPGLVMPAEELTAACQRAGALVLLDGAHAPGNIPLNLTGLAAEFYVGNGHKWLFSPKGSAFVHVKGHAQNLIFPNVIDDGPGKTPFARKFIWQGTNDPSAMMALPDAIDWRQQFGDAEIMEYMTATAEAGGQRLAAMWGTSMLPSDPEERKHLQAAMVTVRLPCGGEGDLPCPSDAEELSARVLREAQTFVPIGEYAGTGHGLWARVSAAVYNEVADFEMYGAALLKVLQGTERQHVV